MLCYISGCDFPYRMMHDTAICYDMHTMLPCSLRVYEKTIKPPMLFMKVVL